MPLTAPPTAAVGRALGLLELFASADHGVRLSDASERLGLAPSTVHRLLGQLVRANFVQHDAARRVYYPGEALLALAASLAPDVALRASALPELRDLVSRTGEPASLAVLRGARAYFIASLHRPGSRLPNPHAGGTVALHASATGKALLAAASREVVEQLVPTERLRTRARVTTRTALFRELDECRVRGFALSFEETAPGITAVASPIAGASGHVYGALSVATSSTRVRRDDLFAIGRALCASSARIGLHLP
jgi:IclR family acetate operon transcriptional repressor